MTTFQTNAVIAAWIISFAYCMWRITKRNKSSSLDGVTGTSVGLEVIMVILIGPLLATVDIAVTLTQKSIKLIKREKSPKEFSK
jgi:hypothetical protein